MSITTDGDREDAAAAVSGSHANASSGGVGAFLSWWGDELAGLLPASFRKAFGSSTEVAIVQEVDGQVVMRRKPGTGWKTLTPGGKSPGGLPKGGVIYLLPEGGALRRERRLPTASRHHIQDIMNLQMASETPFTIDEVYTDSLITAEIDDTREIVVSQALAPRETINGIVDRMRRGFDLELAGIDVIDIAVPSGRGGYNLLPPAQRPRARSGQMAGVGIVLLILAGTAVFAGTSWRDLQQRRIDAADALIADTEGGAAGAMQVSTRVTQGVEAIRKLAAEQKDPLAFMRVYNEVAAVLPDGSWLEEFTYERPIAFATGLSANSATLVQAFETSDLIASARFAAPVVTDPLSGAERFRIEITFKTDGAAPAAPAGEPQQ